MIRSMTGFGSAEGPLGAARVTVEVRTVNHRFFNPSIKLPASLSRFESEVRDLLRQRIARGHVSVSARIERPERALAGVDEEKFAAYVTQLRVLKERYALGGEIDIATVIRMPDVFANGRFEEDDTGTAAELLAVVDAAVAALMQMRADEGSRLSTVLLERLAVIERALGVIASRAPLRVVEQRDRLRQAVRDLTEGIAVDEQRIAQEIAILSDRLDVSEELDRFRSHITAFRAAMHGEGDAVGKRLGFLLQEMLREANTTGSKANDSAILAEVLAVKEELERMREQVENVE